MRIISTFCLVAATGLASGAAFADDETPPVVNGRTYVQHQILSAKMTHPGIHSITVVGARPDGKAVVVLGSTESAARVFTPVAEPIGKDGSGPERGRFVVREPFLSSTGHRIGTIEVAFPLRTGKQDADRVTASLVQAQLARDTLSAKNAVDPYPFDAAWGPDTYAQQLTEKTVAHHPDLLVMMIHATPPGGAKNLIVGSNIGRFGKIADDDDARVIDKGSTNLEIGGDNDRFETELPLNDASGTRIGALGLVFRYRPGDDKEAIHRHGLAIRDEIARSIPSSARLFDKAH